jgi:putative tryptophan/tyrosine transport system substrate-binding protein
VTNFNRPGGNITGVTFFTTALDGKRLELLNELVRSAFLIGVLVDADSPLAATHIKDAEAAGRAIGRQTIAIMVRRNEGLGAAFTRIAQSGARAVLVGSSPFFTAQRQVLVALAERDAIPASYSTRDFVAAGGLMSYGSSITDAHRRAGIYAGRILKGENPAELPVQQPTKFELVINLKTAKALGLEISDKLLALADEVIE